GEISVLVVSKVANFSIDLPEATVAIQVSGTFGSRQEEAQRLGRVLRPKADGHQAHFYSVVARDTLDQVFSAHRQRFLAEQGYAYRIRDADEVLGCRSVTADAGLLAVLAEDDHVEGGPREHPDRAQGVTEPVPVAAGHGRGTGRAARCHARG
uniref:helicase-related protein n=1 Tax=Clavibacter michiganensis TaxID=28447 RepID=UPI00374E1E33